jgi:hypothetical protein
LQTVQGEEAWWRVDPSFLRMTKEIRHAELVSAPHMLSVLQAVHLSCGILKQVQDDFSFITCHTRHSLLLGVRPSVGVRYLSAR